MADDAGTLLKQREGDWLVRVKLPGGGVQELRCATEDQARYLATLLAMTAQRPSKLRN